VTSTSDAEPPRSARSPILILLIPIFILIPIVPLSFLSWMMTKEQSELAMKTMMKITTMRSLQNHLPSTATLGSTTVSFTYE
jgi:hypothetical protein